MKKHWIWTIITVVIVLAGAFWYRAGHPTADESQLSVKEPKAIPVTTRGLSESREARVELTYPASIEAESATTLKAAADGEAAAVFFSLGQFVPAGAVLVRIDNTTSGLPTEDGYKSAAAKLAQIDVSIAKKNYAQAKRDYDKNRITRNAREVARKNYEAAQVALQDTEDGQVVRAPFAGVVTSKSVVPGQSVAVDDVLLTLSRTGESVARFFVSQNEKDSIAVGQSVMLEGNQGETVTSKITRIAPEAEDETGRFLMESLLSKDVARLTPGTFADAHLSLVYKPVSTQNFILPLSAVITGQNENYIFLAEGERAKKTVIQVVRITGEWAEIATDLPDETAVIVQGNKLLRDESIIAVTD